MIPYVVVLSGQTFREPFASTRPMPWSIETLVAFTDAQVSVAHSPFLTVAGPAARETATGGTGGFAATGAGVGFGGQRAFVFFRDSLASAIALSGSQGLQMAYASFFSFSAAAYSSGQSLSLPACLAVARALSAATSSGGYSMTHPTRAVARTPRTIRENNEFGGLCFFILFSLSLEGLTGSSSAALIGCPS